VHLNGNEILHDVVWLGPPEHMGQTMLFPPACVLPATTRPIELIEHGVTQNTLEAKAKASNGRERRKALIALRSEHHQEQVEDSRVWAAHADDASPTVLAAVKPAGSGGDQQSQWRLLLCRSRRRLMSK